MLQPDVIEVFQRAGISYKEPLGGVAHERYYLNRDDSIAQPTFQKLVAATTEPFVQAILDLAVPQMVFGRVALVGDAAFIPRPHTAASTSKAAANAIALADALVKHNHDVVNALKA